MISPAAHEPHGPVRKSNFFPIMGLYAVGAVKLSGFRRKDLSSKSRESRASLREQGIRHEDDKIYR
jgi:hypothetical protein